MLFFFSPFSFPITLFEVERDNLSAFRMFFFFDLSLFGFVRLSSSLCLGWATACDCGTPWTFSSTFFTVITAKAMKLL